MNLDSLMEGLSISKASDSFYSSVKFPNAGFQMHTMSIYAGSQGHTQCSPGSSKA